MSDIALMVHQTGFNLLGLRRNSRAIVFTVVLPVVLLVLFNSIIGSSRATTRFQGEQVDLRAYYTAGIIAYSIMLSGFSSIAISITTAREAGLLKRYRGTPMPSWVFLGAQILTEVATIAVMVVFLLGVGRLLYDVEVPNSGLLALVIYVVAGTATMCAIGLAITRVTPTSEAASAIGPFAAVILAFISGVFITVALLPAWLEDLGRVFPLAHLAQGLQRAIALGQGVQARNLAVLAAWGVAGSVVAWRTFRWEPQAAEL